MPIQTLNPATGEVVKTFNALSTQEINDKLDAAHRAAASWRLAPISERTKVLRRAGELLEARQAESFKHCSSAPTPSPTFSRTIASPRQRSPAVRAPVAASHPTPARRSRK